MPRNNYRNYRRKTTTKRKVAKMVTAAPQTRANLVKLIKSINIKQAEVKYKSRIMNYDAMNHNGIYKLPIWDADAILLPKSVLPFQGLEDDNRIGDRIHAQKFKLRMTFDIPWDRRNMRLKIFYLQYNSDQGDPTDKAQLQHQITGNIRLDPIQKKRWGKGLKYLGDYNPLRGVQYPHMSVQNAESAPGAVSQNTASLDINIDIPMNKKIFFTQDGAMTPANLKENGCILFLPYSTVNTGTGDNLVIKAQGAITLYYKDL